jgi:hypothetical protein
MAESEMREGGCHCGAVTYRAPAGLEQVIECNCSHCQAKGFILSFMPREQFELLSGEEQLTEYQFNKKNLSHLFCSVCGVQAFAFGTAPDGAKMAAVNIRTLNDVDPHALTPIPVDGRSF